MHALRMAGLSTAGWLLALGLLTGCESTDGGNTSVSGGFYYGAGFYDPFYYGAYYYPPDVIVVPPADRPRPEQPIARPPSGPAVSPRPLPSIPSTPRVRPATRR